MNRNSYQWVKMAMLGIAFSSFGVLFAVTWPSKAPTQPTQSVANKPPTTKWEGQLAPDFTLANLNQKPVSLKQFKGKWVFLNFWASWCEPCKEEMPSMQRLYDKLKGQPFEMLAVSLDKDGDTAIHNFISASKLKLTFSILKDPQEDIGKKLYKITGVPETFIIAPDGLIHKHVIGSFEWDNPQILAFFQKLLKDV